MKTIVVETTATSELSSNPTAAEEVASKRARLGDDEDEVKEDIGEDEGQGQAQASAVAAEEDDDEEENGDSASSDEDRE